MLLALVATLMQQPALPDFKNLPHPRKYACVRTTKPPTMDCNFEEWPWRDAPWSEDFLDIEGPQHVPQPRLRTRMKMLWDHENLYVGAQMEEPQVWATLTERDSVIFHDNDFEIFIDPDGDNHNYVEFEMNALNTVWDLLLRIPYRDNGSADNTFNMPGLRSAVKIDGKLNDPLTKSKGWSVTVAIPWKDIAAQSGQPSGPREGDRWRINFSRVEWDLEVVDGKFRKIEGRPEHNWVWSPQWVVNMHWPEMWGYLEFQGLAARPVSDDLNWKARMELMEIYHRQKAFYEREKKWATSLPQLGLQVSDLKLSTNGAGWTATKIVTEMLQDGPEKIIFPYGRLTVRQDSLLEFLHVKRH